MKERFMNKLTKLTATLALFFIFGNAKAQDNDFWQKVQFGGGLGLAIGSGYTDINVAPSAIYRFNEYIAAGVGLQGSYVKQRNWYSSVMYGGSLIVLGNPIPEIQLSAELQQLRVNLDFDDDYPFANPAFPGYYNGQQSRDFWNTALFLGAGYQMDYVTVGLRYNVLFNENDLVYSTAVMPFVRVYF